MNNILIDMDDNGSPEEVALKVYDAIFQGEEHVEVDGITRWIEKTSKSKLRCVKIEGLLYIEQNPNKSSKWAEKARDGAQIMWVMQGRRYLARVMDGNFLDLKKN